MKTGNLPHYVKYTTDVEGGDANIIRVRINPKYKHDVGLHWHEYEHIKQFYIMAILTFALLVIAAFVFADPRVFLISPLCLFAHNTLYLLRPYRQWAEVKAFRVQAEHSTNDNFYDWAAGFLSENYNLRINKQEAFELLTKGK